MANFFERQFSKLGFDSKKWLASFFSGYGRRIMEPIYDRVAQTPFFQTIKEKNMGTKAALEAAVNALVAFLDQKVSPQSVPGRIIEEIFWDSGSELNKRMINGEMLKEKLVGNIGKMNDVEVNFLSVLLTMEEGKLKSFLEWINNMNDKERASTVEILRRMSAEEIIKFFQMGKVTQDAFMKLFKPDSKKSLEETLKPVKDKLDRWLNEQLNKKGRKENG